MELADVVHDFARGIGAADCKLPQANNSRSGIAFQPGIGPHSEAETIRLAMLELAAADERRYGSYSLGVSYPMLPRQKCDLCIGVSAGWEWAIEFKMLRILGDNGGLNDNMLMHILSPYSQHRSALTDCQKLLASGFDSRIAIAIFGYDAPGWPLVDAIAAFEALASRWVTLRTSVESRFEGLRHPFHQSGCVFAWEIESS